MIEITEISITGFAGQPVPNHFFRQTGASNRLAVLFPGLNYTCDMPLLYYATNLLVQQGSDVLQLHTNYNTPAFKALSRPEQARIIGADAQAALQAGSTLRSYSQFILIGKSIGTLALAHLATTPPVAEARSIWLTPLLRQPYLVEAALQVRGPALFVVGTGDSTYDAASLKHIQEETGAQALINEGANHSLEIPGDIWRSLAVLQNVVRGMADFLNRMV